MTVLVVGGTGAVGSQTVPKLAAHGLTVRCLTRSAEKAAALPAGIEGVVGDPGQPETLPAAFDGVEAAVIIIPIGPTETTMALASVNAAREAGVSRVAYLSVPMPEGSLHIPHFASKIPVEKALADSGMAYTILRPNSFFQNDYFQQQVLLNYGVFGDPIGHQGIYRVDTRDIAEAAVAALTQDGHAGQAYEIHGAERLTGSDCADAWSRHLGRPIRYIGDDLDAWAQQAGAFMPAWMVHDLQVMYQFFQDEGFTPSPGALDRQEALLGHPPRAYDDFVAETATVWTG